jgi:hypothetical protein
MIAGIGWRLRSNRQPAPSPQSDKAADCESYWKGKLVGRNADALLRQIEQARERVLARINGARKVGQLPQGNNSFANPYRPNFPRRMLR